MKRFFAILAVFGVATMLWATPTKYELRAERDALKADLIAAGVYEQVVNSEHPLQEPVPAELHDRMVQLWENYQLWARANLLGGSQRINIINPEREPNNVIGDANQFGSTHAFEGDALVGDVDFFSYNVTEPNNLVVFNHIPQNGNTATDASEMDVYAPDGTLIFSVAGNGPFGSSFIPFFPGNMTGMYKFSLATDSTSATATGLDPYHVYALDIPMAPTGNVLVNTGDVFAHTFDAVADDTVHIAVFVDADPAVTEYDIDLYLYDPNGVEIDDAFNGYVNFEILPYETLPLSGTYTVEAELYSLTGTPQEYEFGVYVSALRVPTLSTWGMVFFTCLLAGTGLFLLRRKRMTNAA